MRDDRKEVRGCLLLLPIACAVFELVIESPLRGMSKEVRFALAACMHVLLVCVCLLCFWLCASWRAAQAPMPASLAVKPCSGVATGVLTMCKSGSGRASWSSLACPTLANLALYYYANTIAQERERQRELELIKQQYLGAEKVKKKILKVPSGRGMQCVEACEMCSTEGAVAVRRSSCCLMDMQVLWGGAHVLGFALGAALHQHRLTGTVWLLPLFPPGHGAHEVCV